jgi:tRNA nucleotidyltransferase/poly(A) polymerase
MRDLLRELMEGQQAWIVGGAVRDEVLGRPVVDLDVACHEPQAAARAFAARAGGAPFPLSERHGAWRVAFPDSRTIDFTPAPHGIEADLLTRDFTINAVAVPVAGGDYVDPAGGLVDLATRTLRAMHEDVFSDDPLRLLRAVRLGDELGFRLAPLTERLIREHAERAAEPAGERILGELERLSVRGFDRLEELGLLAPLGGSLKLRDRLELVDSPEYRLVSVLGQALEKLPISGELRRYGRTLRSAERPTDGSRRAIHRFRRKTEPWALDALAYLGAPELGDAVRAAREAEPEQPLVRGDELGLRPGPEIGRLLALIEEEQAVGTITTRDQALELARRERERGGGGVDWYPQPPPHRDDSEEERTRG